MGVIVTMLFRGVACVIALLAGALIWTSDSARAITTSGPIAHAARTCSDYSTQADAQEAADTRDADNDGIYCEALPCPCSSGSSKQREPSPKPARPRPICVKPGNVVNISFNGTKLPHIRQHFLDAIKGGWPRTLVLNRPGADDRRDRLLRDSSSTPGRDRDEYPPAIGRGRGKWLVRGSNPRGWKADVESVPASENRSHGATLGAKLRRFCNGTRFRYVFY